MLIRKISKRACSRMTSQLNTLFLLPSVNKKNYTFLHSSPIHSFFRIQCLSSLHSSSKNPKLYVTESEARSPICLSIDRGIRASKTEAQAALFDYLHCTRGFGFLDAEHISKNSPQFLQDLISKIESEQDVSRALSKFFRYNPINEFEPFFESLGLIPSEFATLLPRGLIFLNDDQVLLDNYHTLCDYGIPRSKIGNMYKEANEIFKYEAGILDKKLRAYEQLGLSRSTIIKLVSCNPLLLVGDVNSAFVRVLDKLKEMGFDYEWIGGYLSLKMTYNWNRILDTLGFLNEVGYSDAQAGNLFRTDTALFFEGSGKNVYVLVGALLKLGLRMNEVRAMFLEYPEILSPKFTKTFWKAIDFLFEIGMEPKYIANTLSSNMKYFGSYHLKGTKTILKNFNNDRCSLCETIEKDPSTFFNLAFKSNTSNAEHFAARNPNNFLEKTEFLTRIGYVENSDEMVKALKKFRGRGDQLQERFDCLVQAGLDFNVVSCMVKRAPTVLNQSKDILEKKLDCLKNYLGYPVDSIATFPSYLCYDMDRISVRFSMYAWLRDKGAAKATIAVSTVLACSDERFVKYFVNIHPEGPVMWANLKKSLPSS
ncbi:hypothetical protein ACJIZ3_013453 [Penstemon smallii]|uniref:Uncharacterized protein n=1 Tax=Penstemon smallii TaxID=265156 RepID=A0ABD3UPW4_9LAMI